MKTIKRNFPILLFVLFCCLIIIPIIACNIETKIDAPIVSIEGVVFDTIPADLPEGIIKVMCKIPLGEKLILDRELAIPSELLKNYVGKSVLPVQLEIDTGDKRIRYTLNEVCIFDEAGESVLIKRMVELIKNGA